MIHQSFDGERGIPLGAVVHMDIRLRILDNSLLHQVHCVPPHL